MLSLLYGPTLTSIHNYWENHRFDYMDLCLKVMSLLTVYRFVIAFLPQGKSLLISGLQSPSAVILEPKKLSCHCFHRFPIICHEVMGPDAMILVFWMLSVKPAFSLSSFTVHSPLSPSSRDSLVPLHFLSQGGVSCMSEVLIFLLAIVITACTSSNSACVMMYSAYKLNK